MPFGSSIEAKVYITEANLLNFEFLHFLLQVQKSLVYILQEIVDVLNFSMRARLDLMRKNV